MRKLMVMLAMVWVGQALAAVTLTGEKLVVGFEEAEGYALSALVHRGHDFDFVDAKAPREKRSPWLLTVRDAEGKMMTLGAQDAKKVAHQAGPERLGVVWEGVGNAACAADLTVTMTVRMVAGKSLWHLKVEGQAPGALWLAEFPRLSGLRPLGEDRMVYPQYMGRLVRDPVKQPRRMIAGYPSPLSMQFMATYGTKDAREEALPAGIDSGWSPDRTDATGLYLAVEDGQCYYKRLGYDSKEIAGHLSLWVENMPAVAQWPLTAGARQVSYTMPYEVAVTAFTGEAFEAGKIYREFAQKQFWCSRGPADKWPTQAPAAGTKELAQWTPTWFRDIGFWGKFYQEPAKIVPEWAAYAKWLQVPMASHYYRGTIAVFDDNYPEMLPTDPYYISGVRDAKDMMVRALPYTNAVIWDRDTQSYLNEGGQEAAIKDEAGNIPTWDIHNELYSYMCPGAKKWRDEVTDTAYKQITEHGLSGVYLDCLTATASTPCYDASHGHTLHGGNYYGMGQHEMMLQMRGQTRAVDPGASFFPEECGEWVIDAMDGFLTLDILRFTPLPQQQVYPLFPIVYHDYTINFGCDAVISLGTERFAWEIGQMLVWGAQPLNSGMIAPEPKAGDHKAEMLREVVQAYYVAGMRFLQGGEAVRMATRNLGGEAGGTPALRGGGDGLGAGLELAARPYEVKYDVTAGRERSWRGPAVIASAWRRDGDVGIVMVNITGQEQPVELRIDRKALGLPAEAKLVRTWPREPEVVAAGEVLKTTVPVRRVAIYVLTSDVARASAGRKLLETPWELLTVEQGEFEALKGAAGTLWACSDGPVANEVNAEGTAATPQWVDEAGQLVARVGVRPKLKEGQALPRKFEEKSFLLLRRLPARVEGAGQVTVLSGDERHLSCVVEGGVTLRFAEAGLVVATEAGTGKVVRPLAMGNEVRVPAGQRWVFGYARPEEAGLEQLVQTAEVKVRQRASGLAKTVVALRGRPTPALLGGVSMELLGLAQDLADLPGALVPGTALEGLHRQMQALVTGQTGVKVWATGEHDWLAPGLTTEVAARVWPGKAGAMNWVVVGTGITAAEAGGKAKLTVTDPQYVERMVPVLAVALKSAAGAAFAVTDVLHMGSNRPMELQGPSLAVTGVAGREAEAQVVLRNWSPFPLRVKLAVEQPAGWQVVAPESVEVPPLSNRQAAVRVRLPEDLRQGTWRLKVEAEYAPGAAKLVAFVTINGQPRVAPLQEGEVAWTQPKAEELATIRQSGRLVLYAQAGEAVKLTIRNVRVTQYTNSVKYRLLGPDLKVVQEGQVAVDQAVTVDRVAEQTGAHFLEVEPGSGSAVIEGGPRGMAEVATPGVPLRLFCSKLTRHFYVPQGAREFALGAQDGGVDEGARLVVTAPGGRVALDRNGNFSGEGMKVPVRPEEAGKVWTLRVEPLQDVSVWLAGEVAPYLSTGPERVLIEQR